MSMMYTYDRRTASSSWEDAEPLSSDELRDEIHRELEFLHKYIQGCQAIIPIYRSLSGPLMEPQIGIFADHIEKRAKDVHTILELQSKVMSVAEKLESEVYHFLVKVVKGEIKMRSGFIELMHDLPDGKALIGIAREIEKIQNEIEQQEAGSHIDWMLEDFLGGGCRVSGVIEKLAPTTWGDEARGSSLPYGFLNLLTDNHGMKEWLDEIRKEEGVEEEEEEEEEEDE